MLILFIDDDEDDYELFCAALGEIQPSFKCVHFKSGLEAFQALREVTILPGHIFLDINMPIMGGAEVLQKLKLEVGSARKY